MKFEEAWDKMMKGKIAIYTPMDWKYRIHNYKLQFQEDGRWINEWVNDKFVDMIMNGNWKMDEEPLYNKSNCNGSYEEEDIVEALKKYFDWEDDGNQKVSHKTKYDKRKEIFGWS